jgi:cysteine desulfurase
MNDSLMRVYFDYNATTPLAAEVIEAVVRATRDQFGNASSVHHFGQQAKGVLDEARSAVATLIGGDPSELVFTSGGTEWPLRFAASPGERARADRRRHLIASAIEHETF